MAKPTDPAEDSPEAKAGKPSVTPPKSRNGAEKGGADAAKAPRAPCAGAARTKSKKKGSRAEDSPQHRLAELRHDPEAIRHAFESGDYPYKNKLRRASYEKSKAALQVELLKVQKWVEDTGLNVVVLFEGRDAAG